MAKIKIPALVAIMAGAEITASQDSLPKEYKKDLRETDKVLANFSSFVEKIRKDIKKLKFEPETLHPDAMKIKYLAQILKTDSGNAYKVLMELAKEFNSPKKNSIKDNLKKGAKTGKIRAPRGI